MGFCQWMGHGSVCVKNPNLPCEKAWLVKNWLIYIDGLEFRFKTPMVTLHYVEHVHIAQIYTRILRPISVQDRNPSPSPYLSPSPAM